jgi:ABC-2 type transport system ATP-binding protein
MRSVIREFAARGKVVLFSSHELETVERVCSRVVILHHGKIATDDSIDRLRTLMTLPTLEQIFPSLLSSRTRQLFRARSRISF